MEDLLLFQLHQSVQLGLTLPRALPPHALLRREGVRAEEDEQKAGHRERDFEDDENRLVGVPVIKREAREIGTETRTDREIPNIVA